MKKTVSFLLVLGCISAAVSCKKETVPVNESAIAAGTASEAVTSTTKFGAMISGEDGDTKVTVSKKMEVGYVRDNIILESFNGKAPMYENFTKNGFKVLLNLTNNSPHQGGRKQPRPYPTDMTKYRKQLETVLNKYKPEVAVIENEPINEANYTGPIENYITQLRTAIDVCHARGIKVADGGLHTGMVCILVYQDFIDRGMKQEANAFADKALTSSYLKAAQGNGTADIDMKLEKTKKQVNAFKSMNLDYVNFHWYLPNTTSTNENKASPGVAKDIADYLRRATGKQVINNEFGQYNKSSSLITSMVEELKLANLSYAIVFSGADSKEAKPLHNGNNLLSNGIAYRDAIAK